MFGGLVLLQKRHQIGRELSSFDKWNDLFSYLSIHKAPNCDPHFLLLTSYLTFSSGVRQSSSDRQSKHEPFILVRSPIRDLLADIYSLRRANLEAIDIYQPINSEGISIQVTWYNSAIKIMKMSEGDEKRLVENYKTTNRQLRKQLQNLNNEIDRILAAKINRIGLKKIPIVDKGLQKSNDAKMLQVQVDNLRKRLELLHHDNEGLKVKAAMDHMAMAKQLQIKLAQKKNEKEALRREVFLIDKNSMSLNTTDSQDLQFKLYDKIQQTNQQLIRVKKIQSQLEREIQQKKQDNEKKQDFILQVVENHAKAAQEAEKIMKSRIEVPVTHAKNDNDEDWRNLKKQFLDLKESKLLQENGLKEENDRLRMDIRELELRQQQKKYKVENIKSLEIRRKQRNYSTLEQSPQKSNDNSFRYRNGNAYKNNTKN